MDLPGPRRRRIAQQQGHSPTLFQIPQKQIAQPAKFTQFAQLTQLAQVAQLKQLAQQQQQQKQQQRSILAEQGREEEDEGQGPRQGDGEWQESGRQPG